MIFLRKKTAGKKKQIRINGISERRQDTPFLNIASFPEKMWLREA